MRAELTPLELKVGYPPIVDIRDFRQGEQKREIAMLLVDTAGSSFNSGSIETVLEGSHDPSLGELRKVSLRDGSTRTVKADELDRAMRNDSESYPSFGSW